MVRHGALCPRQQRNRVTKDTMSKTYKITGSDISCSEISSYLGGLSAEARADWAAGRIDEVMTDHSTSHFGREINDQIKAVAANTTA